MFNAILVLVHEHEIFPDMTSEYKMDHSLVDMGADTYSGGQCDGSIFGGLVLTFFVDYQFRQML